MDAYPLIIIGVGLAGWATAREFRKRRPTCPVLLSTPANTMAQSLNVTLLPHTTVLAIGAQAIRVPLEDNAADQVVSVNSLPRMAAFAM